MTTVTKKENGSIRIASYREMLRVDLISQQGYIHLNIYPYIK